MLILVQEIVVRWTQRTRSLDGARRRNRIPEALPLPHLPESSPGDAPALVHHHAAFGEDDGFATPVQGVETRPLQPSQALHFGCVHLRLAGGALEAVFAYTAACGAPARTRYPRQVFRLGEGEWGRVKYNARWSSLTGRGMWRYHQTTLNVAFVPQLTLTPFSGHPPRRVFSELAHLR